MSATYTPRAHSLAMRILRHIQLHRQPMSRAQLRDEFGVTLINHLAGAVRAGLLRVEGSPEVFHPTDALAAAPLDGIAPPKFWNAERTQLLCRRYPTTGNARLAHLLATTTDAVAAKAAALGLRKTPATLRRLRAMRDLSRRYVVTSQRTDRILQLMRQGSADGARAGEICRLAGIENPSAVSGALRNAIASGLVVRKPINRRHFTYHLNRAHPAAKAGADDGQPLQIVVPANYQRARTPIKTTAANSVFALGGTAHITTTNQHATP